MYYTVSGAMTHSSRKRPRPCDDESCELMPISKRINDLHIRSCLAEPSTSISDGLPQMQPRPYNESASTVNGRDGILNGNFTPRSTEHRQQFGLKNNSNQCCYQPELNAMQNPYYYHINETLYDAHIQRQQRLSKVIT